MIIKWINHTFQVKLSFLRLSPRHSRVCIDLFHSLAPLLVTHKNPCPTHTQVVHIGPRCLQSWCWDTQSSPRLAVICHRETRGKSQRTDTVILTKPLIHNTGATYSQKSSYVWGSVYRAVNPAMLVQSISAYINQKSLHSTALCHLPADWLRKMDRKRA